MPTVSMKRNSAIDLLKFVAVFFVMNSHMYMCYGKYDYLSTGGAFGDALFFFSSGFTLLLGRNLPFDNWYKRRISRIYPSVLAAAIFALIFWGFHEDIGDVLIGKRYWFLGCILVYYIFFYPIRFFGEGKYLMPVFVCWAAICVIIYLVFYKDVEFYRRSNFRCYAFFLFMLQGAWMGKHQTSYHLKSIHVALCLLCIVVWYALCYLGRGNSIYLLSLIPLLGFTRYTYIILTARIFDKLYNTRTTGGIIYIISQLCLEVYLIQKFVFTDQLNFLFPLNIPLIMFAVLIVAYLVKMLAELILQTFRTESYDWKGMLLYRKPTKTSQQQNNTVLN